MNPDELSLNCPAKPIIYKQLSFPNVCGAEHLDHSRTQYIFLRLAERLICPHLNHAPQFPFGAHMGLAV